MVDIESVKNYLKEINVFSGNPVSEKQSERLVCVDPKGEWDQYYMTYPFWQNRPVEFHKSEFERIQKTLPEIVIDSLKGKPRTTQDTLIGRALREIPDSSDTLIIEFGSEYGTKGAGYIASHKRNLKALLINRDGKSIRAGKRNYLFDKEACGYDHDLRFARGEHLLSEPNIEKRINSIYHENDINNVTFKAIELTENNHQEFLEKHANGKNVYLIGMLASVSLPFIMAKAYNYLNAKAMFLAPSALEQIEPGAFPWEIIQRNLNLNDEELKGYIKSVFDPNAVKTNGKGEKKYNYENKAQQRIGTAMKLGISLAIAKEVSGTVYKNSDKLYSSNYNSPNQIIIA